MEEKESKNTSEIDPVLPRERILATPVNEPSRICEASVALNPKIAENRSKKLFSRSFFMILSRASVIFGHGQ